MPKTQRMMELMMRVYEKQSFTVEEMAEEFDVSYRTMLRYLQELSGLGVPLYSEVGKNGGYSILNSKAQRQLINTKHSSLQRIIKPTTHVIGVEIKAPFTAVYMAKAIKPKLWEQLNDIKHRIQQPIHKDTLVGVSLNRNRIYHYIAGIEVAKPTPVPENKNMVSITLPTMEYAVYTHHGPSHREDTDQTYFYVLEKLRKQGMDHDPDAYSLEVFNWNQPQEFRIYIPLK